MHREDASEWLGRWKVAGGEAKLNLEWRRFNTKVGFRDGTPFESREISSARPEACRHEQTFQVKSWGTANRVRQSGWLALINLRADA